LGNVLLEELDGRIAGNGQSAAEAVLCGAVDFGDYDVLGGGVSKGELLVVLLNCSGVLTGCC
jgi:hypothetical protein